MKPKKDLHVLSNRYDPRVGQGLGKLHRQTVNLTAPQIRKKTVRIKGLSMVYPPRKDVWTKSGYRYSIEPGYKDMEFIFGTGTLYNHRVGGLRNRNSGWVRIPHEVLDDGSLIPVEHRYSADQMRELIKSGKIRYRGGNMENMERGYNMEIHRAVPHSAPKSKKKSKKRSSGRR